MNEEPSLSTRNHTYIENNRLYSKFGEIFFTADCRCLFVCTACDHDYEFFDVFIQHIGVDHNFQDVFQNGTPKRLVCISNIVDDDSSKGEESELIEEDAKELIEYKEEDLSYDIYNGEGGVASQESAINAEGDLLEKSLDSPQSTFSAEIESYLTCFEDDEDLKRANSISVENVDVHGLNNPSQIEHKCDMCAKKFASENNLVRHKWRHSSQTKWSCPTCGKVTTTKDGMILHVRRWHTGEKPFKCKFCEKTFASASQRNLHHRVHTGYKPYVCEKCGKTFKLHTVLRYHMDWHLGIKNYKCEKCDKRFHSTSELNNHKSVHTWERPFACSDCNLRFKTKRHLQRHQEVHSGKLKTCKYCNKGFAHISTLTSHLRLHQLDEIE